jgi:urease accessory protein
MPLKAKLHIETMLKKDKTCLQQTFCTQPFKIAEITEDKTRKDLRLMIMSSSPGVLDGDQYEINIDVGEGCVLALETQSYQRIFQMNHGASQQLQVALKKGSSLTYLPHPVVPHRQSVFQSHNKLFLQGDCTLLWGEVISCGRKLNGEVFQFSSYHSLTEILLKNKLVVKENLLIRPAEINLTVIGQMEGFTHQATLLYLTEKADLSACTEIILQHLQEQQNITFGVSALPVNGLLIRILGCKAEQLFLLLRQLASMLQVTEKTSIQTPIAYVA